jgi:hypothetical protein
MFNTSQEMNGFRRNKKRETKLFSSRTLFTALGFFEFFTAVLFFPAAVSHDGHRNVVPEK